MAELSISIGEIFNLIKLNEVKLPDKIVNLESTGKGLKATINPGKIMPNVDVYISFQSFEDGILNLKLKSKAGLIMKILSPIVKKIPVSDDVHFHKSDVLKSIAKRLAFCNITLSQLFMIKYYQTKTHHCC